MTVWDFKPPQGKFFSQRELKQVEALFSEIVPSNPERKIPGAREADAAEFDNRLLAMDDSTYYEIPQWRNLYREALSGLSKICMDSFGRSIEDLLSAERLEILKKLSAGQLQGFSESLDQKRFFEVLRRHCIQGCFADPRWGGNKDMIMWRWYGYLQPAEGVQ